MVGFDREGRFLQPGEGGFHVLLHLHLGLVKLEERLLADGFALLNQAALAVEDRDGNAELGADVMETALVELIKRGDGRIAVAVRDGKP